MHPSKVWPQCETIVPLRLKVCKSCQHVFAVQRKAEHNLLDKAMKRMRILRSDKLWRLKIKERQKLASKLCIDEKKTEATKQAWEQVKLASKLCIDNSRILCVCENNQSCSPHTSTDYWLKVPGRKQGVIRQERHTKLHVTIPIIVNGQNLWNKRHWDGMV